MSETDNKSTFSLEEIKEIFETRYNWVWDNELDQGFNSLLERLRNGEAGLLMLPESELYMWQNTTVLEKIENYHKSVLLTFESLKNNLVFLAKVKSLKINNNQLFEDTKVISEIILLERDSLISSIEDELPF